MSFSRRVTLGMLSLASAIGAAGTSAALSQVPVRAFDSCANSNTCRWTQIDNGNWQPNSGMDPSCHSHCEMWWQTSDDRLPYYNSWSGTGSIFDHAVDWAAATWDQVPEDTPNFYRSSNSSGAYVVYTATSLGSGVCGLTHVASEYQSGSMYFLQVVDIYVNSDALYYDGPVPGNADQSKTNCDIRSSMLHETGHSYGEGHSSVNADVMYPHDNDATSIDGDATNMLAQVYGYPQSGCDSCQFTITTPIPLRPMSPTQLATAMENKATAVKLAAASIAADSQNMSDNEYQVARCADAAATTQQCLALPPPPRP